MEEKKANHFASFTIEQVLMVLHTRKIGLKQTEAEHRLITYGTNKISDKQEVSVFVEFLSHFKSPLIIVLLVAGTVSAFFGEVVNAIMIAGMVLLSGILDFVEEHSANNAAKKLQKRVQLVSTVLRNGKETGEHTSNIVPGDIVKLRAGDIVPGDARIIESDDFFVDQSSLTGESMPCEKNSETIDSTITQTSEMQNMVFFGTSVISGTATVVVIRTGMQTEFGKIAASLTERPIKSEFEIGVTNFGYFIMKVILILVLLIFFFNTLLHREFLQSFLFAVAVAVGVTPELLPVVLSVAMARGSVRMAKSGVIVKKLSAIPNFGSMNILCTDKTGTLTEGKIKLIKTVDIKGDDSEDVFNFAYLNSRFQTGIENLLDKAVVSYKKLEIKSFKKKEEIPFDFQRRIMSVVVSKGSETTLIAKGAPEEIIARCSFVAMKDGNVSFAKEQKQQAKKTFTILSSEGFRVVAVATKIITHGKTKYSKEDESEMSFVGFVAFLDPAKSGVEKTLVDLEKLGVEIKIITGDHVLVAKKICKDIGLKILGVLDGTEIDKWSDQKLRKIAIKTTIFSRFSPEQKKRVIHILRFGDNVVGYLGDGINDAPSLRAADVGISVNNAVDIAKASADIVLTKKSLDILAEGVVEGRKTFGNTMKYIMMGLSSNFGNMFSVLGAIFFLPFLPMLPVQILFNNFIYDLSQITIPTDKVDSDWLSRPRHWNLKFIKKFMLVFGPISSFFDLFTFFILYYCLHLTQGAFQTGWFIESLATQTLVIHIIRTRKIPFIQSVSSLPLIISTVFAVSVGWIIPFTPIGTFFHFEPLPMNILILITGIVIAYLLTVEVVKRFFFRNNSFGFSKHD